MNTDILKVAKEAGVAPEKVAKVIIASQKIAVMQARWQCCLNCLNWQKTVGRERCTKFDAVPPFEVVVHGCEQWEDDIPF